MTRINIQNVYISTDSDKFAELIHLIKTNQQIMSAALDQLTQKVSKNNDLIGSTIDFIKGLAQQIRDNAGNEEEMNKLADSLDAKDQELATAITDNTPAA